jgi:hypothetical protein
MEKQERRKIVKESADGIDKFLKKCVNGRPRVEIKMNGKTGRKSISASMVFLGDEDIEDENFAGKACLSCYLQGARIGAGIKDEMFPDGRDRDIFCTIKMSQISGRGMALIEVLLRPKEFRCGNYTDAYVCQLYLQTPTAENIEFYEQRLLEQSAGLIEPA